MCGSRIIEILSEKNLIFHCSKNLLIEEKQVKAVCGNKKLNEEGQDFQV